MLIFVAQVHMYSKDTIQALIQARLAGIKQASEKRDVEELMSWHSKDATFMDVGMAIQKLADIGAQLIGLIQSTM